MLKKKLSVLIICLQLLSLCSSCKKREASQFSHKKQQTISPQQVYKNGEQLFMTNCKSCHAPDMVLASTGPSLGGVTQRYDKKWLYRFTRDSYGMYLRGDKQAVKLIESNSMMIMSSFPNLTDRELDDIYYFIEERYKETLKKTDKSQ